MNVMTALKLFAEFAKIAPSVLEAFTDDHPELVDPPKADQQSELRDDFLQDVADKFPAD